jgi:hypothetical protein
MPKSLLLTCCFCFLFFVSKSQNQLPNYSWTNPVNQVCTYDSTPFEGFLEWEGFQTTDSSYWGTRDTHCFDIAAGPGSGLQVDLNSINAAYPIFVASLLDSSNKVALDSNGLYKMGIGLYSSNGNMNMLQGNNCPDGICNGVQIGIEIPDSAGTGYEFRWYSGTASIFGSYMNVEFCFPTELFPQGNFIRHAFIKMSSDGPNAGVEVLSSNIAIEDMTPYTEKIKRIDAFWNGNNYQRYLDAYSGSCFCNNKMLMYTDTMHPGPNHQSFVEVFPSPNVPTQETIDVMIDWSATLIYQPYTQLRGGLVLGDTMRHIVNLINNGGNLCMYPFIDLVFQNGDGYRHTSGEVKMEGKMACMQFGKGSALTVSAGSRFEYGRPGNGMLAIRSGGKIVLENRAEFVVHNILSFNEYREETSAQKFEVHLMPGSKFEFGADAILTNENSRFRENTFLEVYMEGGTLDDSKLSPEERALIRRIYPSPSAEFSDNLQILGNPFSETLELTLTTAGEMPVTVELMGMNGQLLQRNAFLATLGTNYLQLKTNDLPIGAYLLRATTPYATCTKRVLKAD